MDEFAKYHPLFLESINKNRIGVCKWNESGTSLETAVPELSELTGDKEEWNAIIVRFDDDVQMSRFEHDDRNPYDFALNSDFNGKIHESEVPLIRLTHMLGGIPAPEQKFDAEIIREEHKAPRTIYKPVPNDEEEKIYAKLCEKYSFDGKLPSSILLVSVRHGFSADDIDIAWISHKESKSSEFWKRNNYPSSCRFLVYDFESQGPVKHDEDEFGFWLSVLLLSINEPDSSTLQAYRLYNLKPMFDKTIMTDVFQTTVDRLRKIRHVIDEEIKRDIERHVIDEEELPGYCVDVPVVIQQPKNSDKSVNPKSFGLFSKGANTDNGIWKHQKKDAEELLASSVRSAERTLDQTADKVRDICAFDEEEVSGLSKYQQEDLIRETDSLYSDIVQLQSDLPTGDITDDEGICSVCEQIDRFLWGRVIGSSACIALTISAILILLSNLPALIQFFVKGIGNIESIMLSTVCEFLIVFVLAFAVVIVQKIKFNGLLKRYNQLMKNAFNKLVENAADYSKYMSAITSHSRGRSYLNLSKRKKHKKELVQSAKYMHIKAINVMLAKIKAWSVAHHLKVDFNSTIINDNAVFDLNTPPASNESYTFDYGNSYSVALNNTGVGLNSPFNFVTRLDIVREEIYDDANA